MEERLVRPSLNLPCSTLSSTEDQLAIGTAGQFTALDEIGSATVSTAAVIPSGVTRIVNIQVSATADGAEEIVPVVLLSGNALPGGDTYQLGAGMGATTVGNSNYVSFDSDIDIISGNSLTISVTSLDAATMSIAVLVTMQ